MQQDPADIAARLVQVSHLGQLLLEGPYPRQDASEDDVEEESVHQSHHNLHKRVREERASF